MVEINQKAKLSVVFTEQELNIYRSLTGDDNPVYSDKKLIDGESCFQVPTDLLMGLISNILGTKLPGRGTNWLKQKLTFPGPAYTGEEITAEVEVTSIRKEKNLVNLHSECKTADGRTVCIGESLVLIKDLCL